MRGIERYVMPGSKKIQRIARWTEGEGEEEMRIGLCVFVYDELLAEGISVAGACESDSIFRPSDRIVAAATNVSNRGEGYFAISCITKILDASKRHFSNDK